MSYKIKEIFKSIQGEGYHVGRNAVFVRFGCNLWNGNINIRKMQYMALLDFVGIDGLNGGKYNLDQLVKKFYGWNSTFHKEKKFVILTGGEPLSSKRELSKLKV